MPVQVVTDSVASIPRDLVEEVGLELVSLYINDGETHMADLELDVAGFYRRLADMTRLPTSSQPSVESLVTVFRNAVLRGSEVLGVFMSERMSGTVETARMAAEMVAGEIAGARIEILDSRSNSMEEGFAAIAAARAAQAGATLEACVAVAREAMERTRFIFSPETLEYLRRGGRIGTASALLGGLLQIRPILTVNDGQTDVLARVRTQKRALSAMAEKLSDDVREYGLRDLIVHYIGDKEPAEKFAREAVQPMVGCEVLVIPVSPVIGAHVGPAVGIVYMTDKAMRSL